MVVVHVYVLVVILVVNVVVVVMVHDVVVFNVKVTCTCGSCGCCSVKRSIGWCIDRFKVKCIFSSRCNDFFYSSFCTRCINVVVIN